MPADKGIHAREAITEAARRLFYQKGYGATSYADIAEVTGYGKGNIHYYFKSKNDILNAVTEARLADYRKMLAEWEQDCTTPLSCLQRFVDMFTSSAPELALYGCPMGTINSELGKESPELQQDTRRMFDLFLQWLTRQFGRMMDTGRARESAEQLMVMLQGASLLAHAQRDSEVVSRQAQVVLGWLSGVHNG